LTRLISNINLKHYLLVKKIKTIKLKKIYYPFIRFKNKNILKFDIQIQTKHISYIFLLWTRWNNYIFENERVVYKCERRAKWIEIQNRESMGPLIWIIEEPIER